MPRQIPAFQSILGPTGAAEHPPQDENTLHDLALDEIVDRLGDDAPAAVAAFRAPLATVAEIEYRQAVFAALEHPPLRAVVEALLAGLRTSAELEQAVQRSHVAHEPHLTRLRAVCAYIEAVSTFDDAFAPALAGTGPAQGWRSLHEHVHGHRSSPVFVALAHAARGLRDELATLRHNILIRGPKVTVAATDDEPDLGRAVEDVFARFRRREARDHHTEYRPAGLDHVQGWILEQAARVHPKTFDRLHAFARDTGAYVDPVLARFSDEVRFYLAYLDHMAPLRAAGLPVTYPRVSAELRELELRDGWDLALATRLVEAGRPTVTNDLTLTAPERIVVVSGPNQGGKTTTARMFGQVHHLAAIGCPVPAHTARIFLCDRVLSLFERQEGLETLEGRLGAEVRRLHDLLEIAGDRSVVVINEAFASTALADARILTRALLERLTALGCLATCVTFIDELSRLGPATVSMVAAVDPNDPAVRTFRVERRVADGRAYARSLAEKHGLTDPQIRRRLDVTRHRPATTPRETDLR